MTALTRDEISRLSPPERLTLIGELWDSIDDTDMPLPLARREALERRLIDHEQDKANAVTWDQLKAELVARAP